LRSACSTTVGTLEIRFPPAARTGVTAVVVAAIVVLHRCSSINEMKLEEGAFGGAVGHPAGDQSSLSGDNTQVFSCKIQIWCRILYQGPHSHNTRASCTRMTSLEQLERQVAALDFAINMLASRTPLCGPGHGGASQEDRLAYIRSQEQLDSLILEYEEARRILSKATAQPQQQQRRMTIG